MEKETAIIRPYTDEKIEEWAAKVGGKRNLKEIVISTEDNEDFHYLVKKPNRSVMAAIADYDKKNNVDGIQKVTLGCILEGDRDAYEHDGGIYTELLSQIGQLVQKNKGSIKNV